MTRLATPLLAATLAVSPGAAAFGQTTLALTGGVNLASIDVTLRTDPVPDFQSRTGMVIGLALTMPLWKGLDLRLDGRFTQKGGHWSGNQPLAFEASMRTEYLEFAALLKAQLPLSGDRVSVYAAVGPALAIRASCDWREEIAIVEGVRIKASQACVSQFLFLSDFDLGLFGVTGLEIGLSERMGVSIGLAYVLGLLDVDTNGLQSLKNRAMTFQVGIVRSIS